MIRRVENADEGRWKTQDSYASEMWMSVTFSRRLRTSKEATASAVVRDYRS